RNGAPPGATAAPNLVEKRRMRTMGSKLYVGNLPEDASTYALRSRFAEIAPVLDVELAVDRASGRMRGYALVTMESNEGARRAIEKLDGARFEDRRLRVSE